MLSAYSMLFFYVESPLHAGTGRTLGVVDLPIQRDRTTNYPIVQGSGVKGQFRAITKNRLSEEEWLAMFGPDTKADHAGALSFGDARLLLFPVRSLSGVFAWTTSQDVLARFIREANLTGIDHDFDISQINPSAETAMVGKSSKICLNKTVVLEEFSYNVETSPEVDKIGKWLSEHALPQTPEYKYWRDNLPQKLCVLSEDAFRDFALYATEIQTHVKINPDKQIVSEGALWTTEMLPTDALMYAPLMAADSYRNDLKSSEMLAKLNNLGIQRIHLGGDITTGQGFVALRMENGREK